ncbi:MAG: DUF6359 domain-containing protein [Bacteroidales bacterium]
MKHLSKLTWAVIAMMGFFTACSNVEDDDLLGEKPGTENPGDNGNGGNTATGEGSFEKPYSIAAVLDFNPQSTTDAVKTGVWAQGFVVGYYNNTTKTVEQAAPFTKDENIMIAASASETNSEKMICIQLPFGDIRTALGLATTEANFGKEVKVFGDVLKYNTFPGIKNTVAYWDIAANAGVMPPVGGDFDVAEMNIAALRAMYNDSDVTLTDDKKITGVVISDLVGGNSTSLKGMVIAATDNSCGIDLYLDQNNTNYNVGDKIEILLKDAVLSAYEGTIQLKPALINTKKVGTATITPKVITIKELNENVMNLAATLVTVTGVIESTYTTWGGTSHQSHKIVSGENSVETFVSKYAKFKSEALPTGEKAFTGIVKAHKKSGSTTVTTQVNIRNLDDIK